MIDIFDAAPRAIAEYLGLSPSDMAMANAQQAQSAEQLARYAPALANSLASLAGIQNSFRPTVRQLSDWECERLGLPLLPEDTQ